MATSNSRVFDESSEIIVAKDDDESGKNCGCGRRVKPRSKTRVNAVFKCCYVSLLLILFSLL